jgi:hypothetical protein
MFEGIMFCKDKIDYISKLNKNGTYILIDDSPLYGLDALNAERADERFKVIIASREWNDIDELKDKRCNASELIDII